MEIFLSWKAGIPRLEKAAEGSCTWTNNRKGVGHGRLRIYGLSRCVCRGRWRRLATRKDALEPTVWCLEWPKKLRARLITPTNPWEDLDIHNLEMVENLLAWLVLEGIVGTENICYKHVGLFSDNTAEVSWTQREATKNSAAAGHLIRVLYLRQQVARTSSLVAAHVSGDLNVLGEIPSRSFGCSKQWNCTNDYEFLSLINPKWSLPHQRSWQGFRLSFALSAKVILGWGQRHIWWESVSNFRQ